MSKFSKLKEGDILSLKLSDDIYNEINKFPKGRQIHIKLDSILLGCFAMSGKGLPYNKFKKLFNNEKYYNTSSVKDYCAPYSLEFYPYGGVAGEGGDCYDWLMLIDPSN